MSVSLSQFKPLLKIGVILAIIIIVVLIMGILFSNRDINNSPSTQQSPTTSSRLQTLSNTKLEQEPQFESEIDKLKNVLPYTADKYEIEFIEALNIVNVNISADSADEFVSIKNTAEDFININVDDICALNIFWVYEGNQQVRKSIDGKNLITTGCSP